MFETGEVPAVLPDVTWSSPFLSIGADGAALVTIRDVGRFLVSRGREIRFAPTPLATPAAIESIVLSVVAGVILHERAALPLHASCVEWNGKVIALAGPSGRGKSTLASALLKRGAELISDDITVVRFVDDTPHAAQGAAGLRLWPDAVSAAGMAQATWNPVRLGHSKRVHAEPTIARPPRRLDGVLRIEVENGAQRPRLRELHGPAAAMPMKDVLYRVDLGRRLGRRESLYLDLMRLADRVTVFELCRPQDLSDLDRAAELVEEAVRRLEERL